MSKQQFNTNKILRAIGWAAVCLVVLFAFVAARTNTDTTKFSGVEIVINDASDNFFISKQNVLSWVELWAGSDIKSRQLDRLNIQKLEQNIARKQWVSSVDVFVDDAAVLHINITERQPAARIFNMEGQSFYVDNNREVLPIHQQMAARVPVFTGFAGRMGKLNKKDSAVIAQTVFLGNAIMKDSFLMAMIDQIDINSTGQFELIPKLGNHIVYFGDTASIGKKFAKLKAFYKNVLAIKGWNIYSGIYLDYKDQIVAKLKDGADVEADAARALMLMEIMVLKAKATTADSLILPKAVNDLPIDSSILLKSVEREEEGEGAAQQLPIKSISIDDKNTTLKIGHETNGSKSDKITDLKRDASKNNARTVDKLEAKKKEVVKKPPDKNPKAVMPKSQKKNK